MQKYQSSSNKRSYECFCELLIGLRSPNGSRKFPVSCGPQITVDIEEGMRHVPQAEDKRLVLAQKPSLNDSLVAERFVVQSEAVITASVSVQDRADEAELAFISGQPINLNACNAFFVVTMFKQSLIKCDFIDVDR